MYREVAEGSWLLPISRTSTLFKPFYVYKEDGLDYIEYEEGTYILDLQVNLLYVVRNGELDTVPYSRTNKRYDDPIYNKVYHIDGKHYQMQGEINCLTQI